MLKKSLKQALIVSPCIVGITLIADISPSLAEISLSDPAEQTSQDIPVQISNFDISQTTNPNQEETIIESDTEVEETTIELDDNDQETIIESDTEVEETTIELDDNGQETIIESDTEEEDTIEVEEITVSESNRWHFLIQPYLYLPITIYGDHNIGRLNGNYDFDFDQIKTTLKDDLNFAFLGDFQAWTPNYHIGMGVNFDYIALSDDANFTRSLRYPALADFIPTELDANIDNHAWSLSFLGSYRFYDQSKVNPEGVATEFDLGLLVFDVIGGLNITSVHTDLDLSTNLGGEASFDDGATIVSPVLGGRLRLNISPKVAFVTSGSVAGFGISGLTKWNVITGFDWLFSGNTSLGLGYRFGYISYNSELDNDQDFGVSLNQNGPYLSLSFRF